MGVLSRPFLVVVDLGGANEEASRRLDVVFGCTAELDPRECDPPGPIEFGYEPEECNDEATKAICIEINRKRLWNGFASCHRPDHFTQVMELVARAWELDPESFIARSIMDEL